MQSTAAVFDLGKVLLDFDYHSVAARLSAYTDTPLEVVDRALHDSGLLLRFESGHLSSHEFFAAFRQATAFRAGFDCFAQVFGDIFTPLVPAMRLLREFKDAGVALCLLSNTNPLAVRFIAERFPFWTWFDARVLSFEHGALKPAAALYAVVESVLRRRGPELFFLDDRPENVATALERGWRAIVFTSAAEAREAACQAGLLTPLVR